MVSNSTDMSDDLKQSVTEWLNSQGFPLEMAVAAAFRQKGFWVTQSDYYEDPNTGTQREIDVTARLQTYVQADLVRVTFVVECKVSKDKPWVLFTADTVRLADRARIVQRTSSVYGKKFLYQLMDVDEVKNLPFFTLPARPGYGLAQALRKPDAKDLSYDALTAVAAATLAQAREANHAIKVGQGNFVEVIFPVVVIDGRLFEAYLDASGKIVVNETAVGTLVWRNPAAGSVHSIVRITTLPALAATVDEAFATGMTLISQKEAVTAAVLKTPPPTA